MLQLPRLIPALLIPVAFGMAPAGAADGGRCELLATTRGSSTSLEGLIAAPAGVTGSYRLSVTNRGGSNPDLDQSGAFTGASDPTRLSGMSFTGGTYSAELTVTLPPGATIHCSKQAGGKP